MEYGIARRLPSNFDGNNSPHVFHWSEKDHDDHVWAILSGCAFFYNCEKLMNANVKLIRDFEKDRFSFIALRDIHFGEELFHTYKSLKWRKAFKDLL